MPAKKNPTNVNTNHNVNNNNIHVDVHVPSESTSSAEKKSEPNWYVRTIVGGIIALVLSVAGYYIKNNLKKGKGDSTAVQPDIRPIETTKHN